MISYNYLNTIFLLQIQKKKKISQMHSVTVRRLLRLPMNVTTSFLDTEKDGSINNKSEEPEPNNKPSVVTSSSLRQEIVHKIRRSEEYTFDRCQKTTSKQWNISMDDQSGALPRYGNGCTNTIDVPSKLTGKKITWRSNDKGSNNSKIIEDDIQKRKRPQETIGSNRNLRHNVRPEDRRYTKTCAML